MARDHTSYSLYPPEAEILRSFQAYLTLPAEGIHALAWRDARMSTMFLFLVMEEHLPKTPVNDRDKSRGVATGVNLPVRATQTAHAVWERDEGRLRPLFGTISGMVAYAVRYFGQSTLTLKLDPHMYDPVDGNPFYDIALRRYQGKP